MAFSPYDRRPQQSGGYNREATAAPRPVTALKIPNNFVDQAEQVILNIKADEVNDPRKKHITNTKIRKLFGLFTDLYNEIKRNDEPELNAEQLQSLTTARIRLVYECGRDKNNYETDVTRFVNTARLLEYLKGIGSSRAEFLKFHQYFEALVAYHRYNFGEDKNGTGR